MVTILLDKERRVRFLWADALKLSRRVGGKSMLEVWSRLVVQDPEVMLHCLSVGLAGEEKELETNLVRVAEHIQKGIDSGTTPAKACDAIIAALREGKHLPEEDQRPPLEKEAGADAPTP